MIDRLRTSTMAAATAASLLAPRVASACSVCSGAVNDDTRVAFEFSTAFLTVLPLVMGGVLFWLLRRRIRRIESAPAEIVPVPPR